MYVMNIQTKLKHLGMQVKVSLFTYCKIHTQILLAKGAFGNSIIILDTIFQEDMMKSEH